MGAQARPSDDGKARNPHTRRSRGESLFSPRRLLAARKGEQALELRMAGRRWREIAEALGYKTPQGPMAAVATLLKRTAAEPAARWRALTSERITGVLRTFWPAMLKKDERAAAIVLKAVADLRALWGLDAPVRQVVTGEDGGPIRHQALVMPVTPEMLQGAIAVLLQAGVLMPDGRMLGEGTVVSVDGHETESQD